MIGLGLRGGSHLKNLLERDDVRITALCDIDPSRLHISREMIRAKGAGIPLEFGKDDYDYRNLLAVQEVDAVIISTLWRWHSQMAVDAMKAGKYVGLEVSAATTLEECWDLVNVHEETRYIVCPARGNCTSLKA